jgi:hypothetical protein
MTIYSVENKRMYETDEQYFTEFSKAKWLFNIQIGE